MERDAGMSRAEPDPHRRRVLAMAGTLVLAGPLKTAAMLPAPTGWVLPRMPAPAIVLTDTDARKTSLSVALAGKVTAVQLMFTGCSSTCPIQGALFAALAAGPHMTDVQLLSISIDGLGDTPASLAAWQARFGQHPVWRAAVAEVAETDRLAAFMKGASAKAGTHTAQVFVFDRNGLLCYRTGDSPAVADLAALLAHVARLSW